MEILQYVISVGRFQWNKDNDINLKLKQYFKTTVYIEYIVVLKKHDKNHIFELLIIINLFILKTIK